MAIVAGAVDRVAGMLELLAVGCQEFQFLPAALRQDRVTGVAVVGFDLALAVRRLVFPIMAPETAWPILMANVIRIGLPGRLHLREEIIFVNLLDRLDKLRPARLLR